jgi:pimeloyl-ACP methyl ester carboxylesterase
MNTLELDLPIREPYFREVGAGPGVVCVHSNASSSSQWRALMETLASGFHVLAPDTHGAGKGPAWPTDRPLALRDEVALLEPVFTRAGTPFSLVGHSYGGAVALVAAVQQPQRLRALVLYEPTLFALVDAAFTPPNDADGIRQTVAPPPSTSSISGWARAPGARRRRRGAVRSRLPSSTCRAGVGRSSANPHRSKPSVR